MCGLYYKPGSTKARLAVQGIRQLIAFCAEHGVPCETSGKVVVARRENPCLDALLARVAANGLEELKMLGLEQFREFEPRAVDLARRRIPRERIVNYVTIVDAMVPGDPGARCCEMIVTGHSQYDYVGLTRQAEPVFNTGNATNGIDAANIARCQRCDGRWNAYASSEKSPVSL